MKDQLLALKDVRVAYGGVRALDGVTLTLDEGEIVAVMGPNGAGKSTVLKSLFGLAPVTQGHVLWHGDVFTPVPHLVVHRGLAYVPQGRRVFTDLTVEENLRIGAYIERDRALIDARVEEVMETFPELRKKRQAKSGTLSGGQQQMLAIGRGLMTDPKVLLLDEPTLGLSPKLVKEMFAKMKEINTKRGTAILVVEHNLRSLLGVVDRAYVLDRGRVVIEDTAQALASDDRLERVFMGTYTHASKASKKRT